VKRPWRRPARAYPLEHQILLTATLCLMAGGAVMLCSFTTIVGYGSLMLSDFQALESFGKLAVAGEVASSLAALVVLPAFFTWRGGRA